VWEMGVEGACPASPGGASTKKGPSHHKKGKEGGSERENTDESPYLPLKC